MPALLGWLQQAGDDVPASDDWLSPAERAVLGRIAVAKRRTEWRLGRWTAKRALLLSGCRFRALKLPTPNGDGSAWPRLEVRAAADGAPEAFLDGRPLPVCLSLTHCAGRAACVVAGDDVRAGCDLELVERREQAFVEDYFTPSERAMVASAGPPERALVTTLIWSAKESALKALRVGLRADTREVDVRLLPCRKGEGWARLAAYRREAPRLLSGWWRAENSHVLTLVSTPRSDPPVCLLGR